MHKKIYLILIVCLLAFTTACGVRQNEDGIKGQEDSVNDTEKITINSEGEVPEKIEYVISNAAGDSRINVSADVVTPDLQGICTYSVVPVEFDKDYITGYANRLFDNGEYDIRKPVWACDWEELEEHKLFFQQVQEVYKTGNGSAVYNSPVGLNWMYDLETVISLISNAQENLDEPSEITVETDGVIYRATDGNLTGEVASFWGNVDGVEWSMGATCFSHPGNYQTRLISMQPVYDRAPIVSYVNMDKNNANLYGGENYMNLEEARAQAKKALEKLDIIDMEIVHTGQACVENQASGEQYLDGYYFVFARNANFKYWYAPCTCITNANGVLEKITPQSFVYVTVTSAGVQNISIGTEYDVTEALSMDTQVLSFEQVDTIARDYFQKMVDERKNSAAIESIEFGYVYMMYDEERYAIVPVWIYYARTFGDYDHKRNTFVIFNAIDGSIINGYNMPNYIDPKGLDL